MKLFSQLLVATFLLFGLSCSSSKQEVYQLQKEAPFKINNATYQEWVAGVKGGGSGITVILEIEEFDSYKISLDSVYFRDYKASVSKSKGNYIAHIKTNINKQEDIILHQSPQNEYGNKAPAVENKIPSQSTSKDAILVFKEKNKVKYLAIKLTKVASILYQ